MWISTLLVGIDPHGDGEVASPHIQRCGKHQFNDLVLSEMLLEFVEERIVYSVGIVTM